MQVTLGVFYVPQALDKHLLTVLLFLYHVELHMLVNKINELYLSTAYAVLYYVTKEFYL